jgi:hypothetical protein
LAKKEKKFEDIPKQGLFQNKIIMTSKPQVAKVKETYSL